MKGGRHNKGRRRSRDWMRDLKAFAPPLDRSSCFVIRDEIDLAIAKVEEKEMLARRVVRNDAGGSEP